MNRPLRIVITTGDADGIGTEISAKALEKLKPQKGVHFIFWRTPRCPPKHLRLIDSQFSRITVATWPEALRLAPGSHKEIIDINSNLRPPKWVELAAKGSLFGHVDAIATAPLSKTEIVASGFNVVGHTEILKKVSSSPHLFMAFVGKHFNVLLCTGHLAINEVAPALSSELVGEAILAANRLRRLLPKRQKDKPIALLGLNPHAGEEGIIGDEEIEILAPALKDARRHKIPVQGPLVPDAAFFKDNWSKYSVFVCPYHDQGLIPFKMIHGQDSGVHITMGLPFVRTSVDHGTAKNIFGKNRANPSSMIEALKWAIMLAKQGDNKLST
ncbi:MAG: 4-hydroxythreonine-4-phosphate dehydrogenase PdxA [Bdellovibrionaceae bacterium]|nr:4-hydroxythreonine-4-phosphate dehydrogenase PdxA [Bdellovibrionales bacterium]MCB9085441.1 4-hydroxythreonine-4-phosphate dehydrogenase PdxA [Pseudobdellovibrionaceae bacterium]